MLFRSHTNADGITEYAINRLIAGRISTIATSMLLTYITVRLIMYAIISTQRNIASDVLKDYIDDGTGDFERSTKIYQMTRTSGDKNIPQNLTYIDIDTSYISKLVDIMQEKTDLPYGFSTHIMTDMELLNDTAHKSGGASSIQGFSLSDLNTFYTYKPKNASTQERLNSIQKLKDYFSKNYRYTLSSLFSFLPPLAFPATIPSKSPLTDSSISLPQSMKICGLL